MSSSTVDSKGITVQDFSCHIEKIEFSYTNDEHEEKKGVLYDSQNRRQSVKENTSAQSEKGEGKGMLIGRVSNDKDYEYFFITNYKGKKLKLVCNRQVNQCQDEKHLQYDYDYIDIKTKELKSEEKLITDGNVTLYYYDIFTRTAEYTKAGAKTGAQYGFEAGKYICSNEDSDGTLGGLVGGATGGLVGTVAGATYGNLADMCCSLRFIHLPRISFSDKDYGWHALLDYRECPHRPSVPTIVINTYPDIEFNVEIGFTASKHKYYATNSKKDTQSETPFSFKFSSKYASIEKELNFEKKIDDKELSEEAQKGSKFYQAVNWLAEFLKNASKFTEKLKESVEEISGESPQKLAKDLGVVSSTFGKLSTMPEWVKGTFEISPAFKATWRYSVSEDLAKLGRHIELELGVECKGTLTIDLIKVAEIFIKNSTTAATVTATAGTGGLAGPLAFLVKFLVDKVVSWLVDKFEKGVKFDLELYASANIKPLPIKIDTCKDKSLPISTILDVELKIGIKLIAALEYKTSECIILSMKGEVKASAEASVSLTWNPKIEIENGYIGLSNDASIKPFTLKFEYMVAGSFEIFGYEVGTSSKNKVKEWKSKEFSMDTKRWNWFKLYDSQPE